MPARENSYIFYLNILLAGIHYASAFALFSYGLEYFPNQQTSSLGIFIRLWDKIDDGSCSRDLFVEDTTPTQCAALDVDVYVFCVLFGVISGTYHLALACWSLAEADSVWLAQLYKVGVALWATLKCGVSDNTFPKGTSVAENLIAPDKSWGANGYRWFDYSASTSLMIIVIYVSFGIADVFSCLLAAISIVLLMVLGYATELVLSMDPAIPQTKAILRNLILVGFLGLFVIFVPVIANMQVLISSDCNIDGSKPPPAVQAVGITLFLLFASFGFVPIYAYNRFDRKENIKRSKYLADLAYSTLSMWVKTFLHWGLATIVLGQSTMVQGSYDEAQEVCSAPDFSVLWFRFSGVIGTTTVLSLVTFFTGRQIVSKF